MKNNFKKNFSTIFLIFILIILMTFPLTLRINTYIPGFFSTDESYVILWHAWLVKFSLLNTFLIKKTQLIAYPFGIDFYVNKTIGYLWFFINYFLSILTNPVLTYNFQVLFNFFSNIFFIYLLVYYFNKSRLLGFFSGIIFGFCPYIFVRSWQHLGETYLWPMPLFLWSLFRLRQENNLKIKILFILSFVPATINFDVIYYAFVILTTFLVYLIFDWKTHKAFIKNIIFLSIIASLVLTPQFYPIFKNLIFSDKGIPSAYNIHYRPFEDLFTQSAKPLSYLLPAVVHPIFGKFTEKFVGSFLYGDSFTEHTLYLGWIPLILAFFAFRRWRRVRKQSSLISHQPSPYNESFYIGFFIFLAVVSWFFSQPPWWKFGPIKIYMPSFFMYKILPMFRAYCRFGIVVMLSIAILAGFGLKFILEKFRTQKTKIAITTLFCGLVLFEFWNYPPYKVIDVSRVPLVYYWLKEQPENFVIAEYPLDIVGPSEMYKFYQTKHEKKIINATIPGTYAHKVAKTITKLSESNTAEVLKWMGVRYVLVHKEDYVSTGLIEDYEELNKIPQNPGLKFVKNFPPQECPQKDIMCVQKTGPIDVYEVIAQPIEPSIITSAK